jgi:hypothetical protein
MSLMTFYFYARLCAAEGFLCIVEIRWDHLAFSEITSLGEWLASPGSEPFLVYSS